jgi:hypothetical protein
MQSSGTDRPGRKKIIAALVILLVFAVAMVLLQVLAGDMITTAGSDEKYSAADIKTEFSWTDFRYGPQSWRPFARPLPIGPEEKALPNETWYFMFIHLNGTPYGGNPDIGRSGYLQVDYHFTGLAGTAAFHIYGVKENTIQSLTNRQDGYGRSGFFVTGTSPEGARSIETVQLPAPSGIFITTSDSTASSEETGRAYNLRFDKGGDSGLDSLHIASDISRRKGDITITQAQQGTFYITHTGGSTVGYAILLVAVNATEPDTFVLSLHSKFMEV